MRIIIDAAEFVPRVGVVLLVFLTDGGAERAAAHVPEFGYLHALRVDFEGGTHGGEEYGRGVGGPQDEVGFLLEAVDGVEDVVVGLHGERFGRLGAVGALDGRDFGVGIDLQQPILQRFHFHLAHGTRRGHKLAVDVARAYAVGIDQGQMRDPAPHEPFRAPAAHAAHAEEDDADLAQELHHIGAHEQCGTAVDRIFCG